jgi:hypothetical protein
MPKTFSVSAMYHPLIPDGISKHEGLNREQGYKVGLK